MHFIFVACNKNKKLYRNDPSFIYRCENLAYGLQRLGHTVEFAHLRSFSLKRETDVVVFHRPSYSLKLLLTLKYLKRKAILSVFEVDDLIFDPKYTKDSPAVRNKILSVKKVEKKFKKNLKALKLFSYFSTSTDPLVEHIKNHIPNASVVTLPNCVHYSWRSIQKQQIDKKDKIITYFPGTKSHDKDFALISKELSAFLKIHPEVKLHITGPLEFKLDIPLDQIVYNKKVPFSQHWKNYQNGWINLAPLEISPFTECKSALKVIEAGYWGIPTISMPNHDTKRFINSGAIIIDNETQLFNKLEALYDINEYLKLTKNLQTKILELAEVEKVAEKLVKYLKKKVIREKMNSFRSSIFFRNEAKNRRNNGLYDCETLMYYKKVLENKKTPEAFIDYHMFRRDLGFPLSVKRAKILIKLLDKLGRKYKKQAILLLKDISSEDLSHVDYFRENRKFLIAARENQEKWYNLFKEELYKNRVNGICVVGNASKLHSSVLGDTIDSNGLVVRFNHCWDENEGNKDIGKKLDIWVSAPDYRGMTQESASWIIISGPNMIYREVGWNRFERYIQKDGAIVGVPLKIWKELISILNAPPSAGVLTLFWFRQILDDWDGINAAGFDLVISTDVYHYADPNHQPGNRHNWEKEKKLLMQWQQEGLKFLN